MKNKTKENKKEYILTDLAKANRTALRSYLVCAFLYAVSGVVLYRNNFLNVDLLEPALYFFFLFLPLFLVGLDYKECRYTEEFRYNLYFSSLFFYLFLLQLDWAFMYIVFAVWLVGTSILYYDIRFSRLFPGKDPQMGG